MLKYNFPYGTPNGDSAVVLNFLMPGSYMGNIDDDFNKNNDGFNKIKAELDQVKNALCTVQKELERCKNNPNKCNKEEFDRVTAKLKECQNNPNKCNKEEFDRVTAKLKECQNNPNKCNKEEFDRVTAKLKECQNDPNKCNKAELDRCKTERDQCKNDPNKCNKAELDRCKTERDQCKNDPNKCNKAELDRCKTERDQCKNDPNKCNKEEFDRVTAKLKECQNNPNKCNKEEFDRVTAKLKECQNNPNKCNKAELDQCKSDLTECNKGKVVNPVTDNTAGVVTSQAITSDHAKPAKCGDVARIYKTDKLIGNQGFYTRDLVESLHPAMYQNTEIKKYIEDGTYRAVNYVFAFTSNLYDTAATLSNMSCKEGEDEAEHFACQCSMSEADYNPEHNKNFFMNKKCPNLISKSSQMPDTKAKQISPLILVNESGEMIGKDGKNTGVKYEDLKLCLLNGRIKDNTECQKFAETMQQVGWDTDKTVQLKTSTSAYSYGNQDIHLFADTNLM